MASTCAKADLDWLLGESSSSEDETLEQTVQGIGGGTIPGGV